MYVSEEEEEEEDLSEDLIFHLKARKTEQLTELYGQTVSSILEPEDAVTYMSSVSSDSSVVQSLSVAESTRSYIKPDKTKEPSLLSSSGYARISQQDKTSTSFSAVSEVSFNEYICFENQ